MDLDIQKILPTQDDLKSLTYLDLKSSQNFFSTGMKLLSPTDNHDHKGEENLFNFKNLDTKDN